MRDVKTTVWGLVVAAVAGACSERPGDGARSEYEWFAGGIHDPLSEARPLVTREYARTAHVARKWSDGERDPDRLCVVVAFRGSIAGEVVDGLAIDSAPARDLRVEFGDADVARVDDAEVPTPRDEWIGERAARRLAAGLAAIDAAAEGSGRVTLDVYAYLEADSTRPYVFFFGTLLHCDDARLLLERALEDLDALQGASSAPAD